MNISPENIQEQMDRVQIQEVIARYSVCVDTGDSAGFSQVFTEDGLFEWRGFDLKIQGRKKLKQLATAVHKYCPGTQHTVTSPVITIKECTAHCTSQLVCFLSRPEQIYTLMIGYYEDELIRIDDHWFIAHRLARIENPEILMEGKIAEYFKPLGEALAAL